MSLTSRNSACVQGNYLGSRSASIAPVMLLLFALLSHLLCVGVCFGQPIAAGAHRPEGRSEFSVIGNLGVEGRIFPGTSRFATLVRCENPRVEFADELARRMCHELRTSLDALAVKVAADLDPMISAKVRVLRAWVDPSDGNGDEEEFSHYEGRGLDLTLVDGTGTVVTDRLADLAGWASEPKRFDWVQHVAAVVDDAGMVVEEAYIHVSIAMPENPTLVVQWVSLQAPEQNEVTATAYLQGVKGVDDHQTLDAIVHRFPDTIAAHSALAVRYSTLLARGKVYLEQLDSGAEPLADEEKPALREVISEYNDFIGRHPGTSGSRIAVAQLLLLYRWLNEPLGYLEFMQRYPEMPESYTALLLLQQQEFQRLLPDGDAQNVDLVQYDRYLQRFPQAPQWDTVAALATVIALEQERDHLPPNSSDELEIERRATIHLGEAVTAYQALRRLMRPVAAVQEGATRNALAAYQQEHLGQARYLLERIDRVERLLRDHYPGSWAYRQLFRLQLHWETNGKLDRVSRQVEELRQDMLSNHEILLDVVSEESDATRQELIADFGMLSNQIANASDDMRQQLQLLSSEFDTQAKRVTSSLRSIHGEMRAMHVTLGVAVRTLDGIAGAVDGVNVSLQRANTRLDDLIDGQSDLVAVLTDLNAHTSEGFADVSTSLRQLDDSSFAFSFDIALPTGFLYYVADRGRTLANAINAEASRLTMRSVRDTMMNPSGTFRAAIARGEDSFKAEMQRLRDTIQRKVFAAFFAAIGTGSLIQEPLLMRCRLDLPGDPVYYVNGVLTTASDARTTGESLAALLGCPVNVIYNPSFIDVPYRTGDVTNSYGYDDLQECIYDRCWPLLFSNPNLVVSLATTGYLQENPTSRMVGWVLYHADGPVRFVGHSQGTMIIRNGALAAWLLGRDLDEYQYVFLGSPLGDSELFVATGDQHRTIINSPTDPVAQVLGFRGHLGGLNQASHSVDDVYLIDYPDQIKAHLFP